MCRDLGSYCQIKNWSIRKYLGKRLFCLTVTLPQNHLIKEPCRTFEKWSQQERCQVILKNLPTRFLLQADRTGPQKGTRSCRRTFAAQTSYGAHCRKPSGVNKQICTQFSPVQLSSPPGRVVDDASPAVRFSQPQREKVQEGRLFKLTQPLLCLRQAQMSLEYWVPVKEIQITGCFQSRAPNFINVLLIKMKITVTVYMSAEMLRLPSTSRRFVFFIR